MQNVALFVAMNVLILIYVNQLDWLKYFKSDKSVFNFKCTVLTNKDTQVTPK